mmetsp:Transcript_75347/g.201911  ORF Transcript_75347/g.201911 Transcript_75347/m.201911 type:complete len:214 (-) Transcript_75347:631-1272(-)
MRLESSSSFSRCESRSLCRSSSFFFFSALNSAKNFVCEALISSSANPGFIWYFEHSDETRSALLFNFALKSMFSTLNRFSAPLRELTLMSSDSTSRSFKWTFSSNFFLSRSMLRILSMILLESTSSSTTPSSYSSDIISARPRFCDSSIPIWTIVPFRSSEVSSNLFTASRQTLTCFAMSSISFFCFCSLSFKSFLCSSAPSLSSRSFLHCSL